MNLKEKIDFSVFPGHQGGPHNHTISAIAVALQQARSPDFRAYQQQVIANSKQLCSALQGKGYEMISGGTDNHLMLVNMGSKAVDGARVELVLDKVRVYVNKNTIPKDKSALIPRGIRIGTPAVTTRGLGLKDMDTVAGLFDEGVLLTKTLAASCKGNKLADFKKHLKEQEAGAPLQALKAKVTAFMGQFPLPY